MVMSSRTHTTLFASADATSSSSATVVRLPLSVIPHYETRCQLTGAIVAAKPLFRTNLWSSDEHERFLHGLEMFPNGPWKEVAKVVGTKSVRQTMTHAQKYRQKIERHLHAKPKEINPQSKWQPRAMGLKNVADSNKGYQTDSLSRAPTVTFVLPAATMSALGSAYVFPSPSEAYSNAFDTSFLDQEFVSMLASLEPLSNSYSDDQQWQL